MKFTKNEDAVSPVIGVILMVAITVILAAVIAAFVFGMAGNINKTKVVAATASQQGANTILVTYQGGQDNADVERVIARVADGTPDSIGASVGKTMTFTNDVTGGKDHVIVTARFTDGSTQVVMDTFV
jgi:flagellin-like protein